ncbi:SAM-dependent methyltransferase [Streptomyces sp. NPDC059785]|uniref:SAM-dependent methyltransferase n=1 Tax=Streptomyces sp. NPDC059785 TaxID=3346945 RepID=UPI00365AA61B
MQPHTARMHDYYLGGKDNYPVDAGASERVLQGLPHGRGPAARGSRRTLRTLRAFAAPPP